MCTLLKIFFVILLSGHNAFVNAACIIGDYAKVHREVVIIPKSLLDEAEEKNWPRVQAQSAYTRLFRVARKLDIPEGAVLMAARAILSEKFDEQQSKSRSQNFSNYLVFLSNEEKGWFEAAGLDLKESKLPAFVRFFFSIPVLRDLRSKYHSQLPPFAELQTHERAQIQFFLQGSRSDQVEWLSYLSANSILEKSVLGWLEDNKNVITHSLPLLDFVRKVMVDETRNQIQDQFFGPHGLYVLAEIFYSFGDGNLEVRRIRTLAEEVAKELGLSKNQLNWPSLQPFGTVKHLVTFKAPIVNLSDFRGRLGFRHFVHTLRGRIPSLEKESEQSLFELYMNAAKLAFSERDVSYELGWFLDIPKPEDTAQDWNPSSSLRNRLLREMPIVEEISKKLPDTAETRVPDRWKREFQQWALATGRLPAEEDLTVYFGAPLREIHLLFTVSKPFIDISDFQKFMVNQIIGQKNPGDHQPVSP